MKFKREGKEMLQVGVNVCDITCICNQKEHSLDHFCRTNDQDAVKVPPPRCAVGVVSLLDHTPPPRSLTCILCQEENKDTSSQDKPFVQAIHIQRSAVLRRGQNNDEGTCTNR